jgi:hypothetical protein
MITKLRLKKLNQMLSDSTQYEYEFVKIIDFYKYFGTRKQLFRKIWKRTKYWNRCRLLWICWLLQSSFTCKLPILHRKNFTLASFVTIYTYEKDYYWDNKNYPSKYYFYRVTVIPIGVKGTYYFDQILNANSKWDFYASCSAGFDIRNVNWESDFYGDKSIEHGSSGLYLDIHIGSEYHLNNKLGLFLDLSSGISTLGLAVH